MKSPVIISLAATATASSARSAYNARSAVRDSADPPHLSHIIEPVPDSVAGPDATASHSLTYNWAGAIREVPSGGKFTSAVGTYVVPTPQDPSGKTGNYYSSAWVGLDGTSGTPALLQAGCDFNSHNPSAPTYSCWTEWLPAGSNGISGFVPAAGDTITITIEAPTSTEGIIKMENGKNGQSFTTTMHAPSPTATIEGKSAEWIVEDFEIGSSFAPFNNFGTVTWTGCSAISNGGAVGIAEANTVDIVNQTTNSQVTETKILSSSSVQIQYTG